MSRSSEDGTQSKLRQERVVVDRGTESTLKIRGADRLNTALAGARPAGPIVLRGAGAFSAARPASAD